MSDVNTEKEFARFRRKLGINSSFTTCLAYTTRDDADSNACYGWLGVKRKRDVEVLLDELFDRLKNATYPHDPDSDEMECREELARKTCCSSAGSHLVGGRGDLPGVFRTQWQYILHHLNGSIDEYLMMRRSRVKRMSDKQTSLKTGRSWQQEDSSDDYRASHTATSKLHAKESWTPRSPELSRNMDPCVSELSFASASSFDSESASSVFSDDDYTGPSIYSRETTPSDSQCQKRGSRFDISGMPHSPSQRTRLGKGKQQLHDTNVTSQLEIPCHDYLGEDVKDIISEDHTPASSSQVKQWKKNRRPPLHRGNAETTPKTLPIASGPARARRKSLSDLPKPTHDESEENSASELGPKSFDAEEGMARIPKIKKKDECRSTKATSYPVLPLMKTMREPIQAEKSSNGGWIYVFSKQDAPELLKIGRAGEGDGLRDSPSACKRYPDGYWRNITPGDGIPPAQRDNIPGRVIRRLSEWQAECELGEVTLEFYVPIEGCVHRMEKLIHKTLHKRLHRTSCVCTKNHTEWFRIGLDEAVEYVCIWQRFAQTIPYSNYGIVIDFWQKYCSGYVDRSEFLDLPAEKWVKTMFTGYLEKAEQRQELKRQGGARKTSLSRVTALVHARK